MPDRLNNPADEANSPRTEEREQVRVELESRLEANGVRVTGSESDDQIVAMSDAFELFDAARERAGADSMTNTFESSRPEDPRFVVPQRRDDESTDQYIARIRAAARRLADDGKHG
jgi:acid stress-induced BolA-like protein IbaG/YrbA